MLPEKTVCNTVSQDRFDHIFIPLAPRTLFVEEPFNWLGMPVVFVAILLSAPFAPLIFLGDFYISLVGMILWGIGFAVQDTLLKAVVAGMLPEGKRNLAFGLFYAGYGCGWLIGSVTTGVLYDRSHSLLIAFSVMMQLVSLPLFFVAHRKERRE